MLHLTVYSHGIRGNLSQGVLRSSKVRTLQSKYVLVNGLLFSSILYILIFSINALVKILYTHAMLYFICTSVIILLRILKLSRHVHTYFICLSCMPTPVLYLSCDSTSLQVCVHIVLIHSSWIHCRCLSCLRLQQATRTHI